MKELTRSILGSLQMEYSELEESCPEIVADVDQSIREFVGKIAVKYSEWRRGRMDETAQKMVDQIVINGQSPEGIIFYYWLNNVYGKELQAPTKGK